MLLPAKMKRIEIIVHKDHYDSVMRYLREARVMELLDVKDMLKGYTGHVSSSPPPERLFRLAALNSKITNLSNTLQVTSGPRQPAQVDGSLPEEALADIEKRVSSLEKEVAALVSEIQACEKISQFADVGLGTSIREIKKIRDFSAPEGRHRLQDIVLRIIDALPPEQMGQSATSGDMIIDKSRVESVRQAISDQLAQSLSTAKSDAEVVDALNRTLGLRILKGSTAGKLKFEPESPVAKAREKESSLRLKLRELGAQNSDWLQISGERVNAERVVEEARSLCGRTEATFVIEGWLPGDKMREVETNLDRVSDGHCVVQEWSGKNSPTMLNNPKGTGLFQRLTTGFGTPASEELDPTILWIVTYPLFFGLMFGDIGHGLIIVVLSAGLLYAKRKGTRFKEQSIGGLGGLFNMILDGSALLVIGGMAATVCGFLYGTVMGSEEWFHELTGLQHPLWFNPFLYPMTLLKVSIVIGIIHVSSGLALDIVNKVRNRDYRELLAGPGLWLWFYLTLAYLILSYGFGVISYVLSNIPVMLVLLGLPSGLMLAAKMKIEGPFEGFGHWMESMLASISHTISYMRIMAMKMIHDVFSLLFLGMLVSVPIYLGVPLFAMLTLVMIVILEAAFVFLQDLRLHWVEWFLKFYSGSGVPFKPFGIQRTYTKASVAL